MQSSILGRHCPDCGADISKRAANCIRCFACQSESDKQRRRIQAKGRRQPERLAQQRSLRPFQNTIQHRFETNRPRRQKPCLTCGGMPWAREPGRCDERGREIAPHWVCVDCMEPYQPAPAIHAEASVRSSAGMAARHGELHGGERPQKS